MSFAEVLIPFALILLPGFAVIALARPIWVPVAGVILGAGLMTALALGTLGQPCNSDPAGCGMARGFEGLILMLGVFVLLSAALAAIAWRLAAGRGAGIGPRLLAMILTPLALAALAAIIFS